MPTPPAATASRLTGVVAGGLAVALGVGALLARHRPPWGDEAHFFDTIQLFTRGISLELLRTYPEMSSPLPFIMYGGWGAALGADLQTLRLLSPLVAWATSLVFWSVLVRAVTSDRLRLLTLAVIVLNPYFVGVSLFVFTDMLALLGLAIVLFAVAGNRPWIGAGGLAVAVLSRQYLAFLAPALVLSVMVGGQVHALDRRRWIGATLVGMIPIGLLTVLWGGALSPDNALRAVYLGEGLRFDPHALSLYLALPAAYLAPLILAARRRRSRAWAGAAALAGLWILVWPVVAAPVHTIQGIHTVGFMHRALVRVLPDAAVGLAFAACGVAGAWMLGPCVWPTRGRREGWAMADVFPALGSACFLLVMPFSYMPWEKYALPLLMFVAVGVAAQGNAD